MKKKPQVKTSDKENTDDVNNDTENDDDGDIDSAVKFESKTEQAQKSTEKDELEMEMEMESSAKSSKGAGKMIVLSTVNDISDVGKLHEKWQEHLSGPIMVIEASAVERMDTSVLQLLCALIKDADDHGIGVEWKDPSDKLKYAVKILGLNGPLKLH